MRHPEKQLFERLGKDGLARVLHDVLDHGRLVRLANTCGLRYPGMRTRSQKRERILTDLVEQAGREETTRKAVFRMLNKETSAAAREWTRLTAEEKLARLDKSAEPADDGQLGLHLYLLAQDNSDGLQQSFKRLLSRPDLRPESESRAEDKERAKLARDAARLKKKITELHKKTKHAEGQLAKSRETAKTLKRDLIQRKGELAESRLLVERLRRELKEARGAAREASDNASRTPTEETLGKLTGSLRRLSSEQRKLAHGIDKLASAPGKPVRLAADALEPALETLKALQKETTGLRRERRKETKEQGQFVEELRAEVRSLKSALMKRTSPAPPPRRKGQQERVGMFVDVQNMYYGARQLKGKLDFDALLQAAVRDRRMIQAKAYVVESKEIDQSGFISMLQQRAIEVRTKPLKVRSDGSMKGDWDMEMALDILDAAPNLDVVVLVSGDGDFTSLVNRVKRMGPRVEVIGWPRNTAKSLVESADHFQPLDRKFMIRSAGKARAK